MPGGANGVFLKSNGPKTCSCADSCGCRRDDRKRLSVMMAWGKILSHKANGKSG